MKFGTRLLKCIARPQTQSTRELETEEPGLDARQRRMLANNTIPQIPQPVDQVEARILNSPKRNKGKVEAHYKLGRVLGTGGFAVVRHAVHKITGEEYACKVLKLPKPDADSSDPEFVPREEIFKEIELVSRANNDYVLGMREFFLGKKKAYLIMDFMRGGMVLDGLLSAEDQHYTEKDARQIFHQLLQGLQYLHKRNVIHRDLKLENLLMVRENDISHIKIVDFGLAKHTVGQAKTVCGTPQFVAPEVIDHRSKDHGKPVDVWSAGVVLFMLLGGYPPFYDPNEQRLFRKIEVGEFSFDDPVWDQVAPSAKDLICKCLILNPEHRITAEKALQHSWFSEDLNNSPLKDAQRNMVENKDKIRTFRQVVLAIQAMKRMGGGSISSDIGLSFSSDDEGLSEEESLATIPESNTLGK